MGIIRDSFVMFRNWADAINALPEEFQLETYKALIDYGTNGEIPENLSPIAKAMMISFSKGMEKNIASYNASITNGKKGGRPPKNQVLEEETQENPEKPSETQENPSQPSQNLNDNVNVNVDDNVNDLVSQEKKEIKKINNKNACACTKSELFIYFRNKFETLYQIYTTRTQTIGKIIKSVIDFITQAKDEELVFNSKHYSCEDLFSMLDNLSDDNFAKIMFRIDLNEDEIENENFYILGCVVSMTENNKNNHK